MFLLPSKLRSLSDCCLLRGNLFSVVLDYTRLFPLFLFFALLLNLYSLLVARLDLKNQQLRTLCLCSRSFLIILLHNFDIF